MIARVRRWIWPGLILLFCLCVFLKLNGSSVGFWKEILNDPSRPEGLLLFKPRPVRADEWHVWTPAALSQAKQTPSFPIENLSLGGGKTPLLMSLPVRHYTTFFRPQLWGFFLFDFERGFSFFWCLKIFALLLASAWFLRQLGIRHTGVVLFGTLWIFFSGFVQWWFSSPAMLPEMLVTWMICTGCAIQFFQEANLWRTAAAFALFVFAGINFALCLYPPFQISLLFLMIAILIGVCLESQRNGEPCRIRRGILLIVAGIVLLLVLLIPFWIDVRSTLQLVSQTEYPGARRTLGGDLSLFKLFSGLASFFQNEGTIPKIYDNISEASNFYPLWPAALIAVLVARWRQKESIPPLIIGLGIVIISLSIYCLLPLPNWLLRATFLNFATERRTLLALGLANIFLCCLFLDRYRQRIFPKWGAIIAALFTWLAIGALFWSASQGQPDFFPNHRQLATVLIANGIVIILFFWETKRRAFMALLAALLVISNAGANPVMRGLAPLLRSEAFREIDRLRAAEPKGKWLVYHDFVLAQLVTATGAPILNGYKTVPDFNFLRRLDPEGSGRSVYNRYAYVACELPDQANGAGARLYQHDCYILYLPPDTPALAQIGCRFFMFSEPWPEAEAHGFSLRKQIMPANLWIYQPRRQE